MGNDNTCICCSEPIPEGRQICPRCESVFSVEKDKSITYVKALEELLRATQPILRAAFFAHFSQQKAADQLYDKITKVIGKEIEFI